MVPKVRARKVENGILVSCNGKEFFSSSTEGAFDIARDLYCKEIAPLKAAELIHSLKKTMETVNG